MQMETPTPTHPAVHPQTATASKTASLIEADVDTLQIGVAVTVAVEADVAETVAIEADVVVMVAEELVLVRVDVRLTVAEVSVAVVVAVSELLEKVRVCGVLVDVVTV